MRRLGRSHPWAEGTLLQRYALRNQMLLTAVAEDDASALRIEDGKTLLI
jgi:hypothetical protein